MPGAPVVLFFLTLFVWVPAAWIYFDAEERGHSGFFWGALALIPFWNIWVVIGYFIVRGRKDPVPDLEYSRTRIYQHVAVMTFYGLVTLMAISVLFGFVSYVRADDPPLPFQEPRGDVLRDRLAMAVAILLVSVPAFAAHFAFMRRRLIRAASTTTERLFMARQQLALFALVVVLSGLIAALALVLLAFELSGWMFDVGGVGKNASSFAFSALPIAVFSLAIVYAELWMDDEFQRGRALLQAEAAGSPPTAAPSTDSE